MMRAGKDQSGRGYQTDNHRKNYDSTGRGDPAFS